MAGSLVAVLLIVSILVSCAYALLVYRGKETWYAQALSMDDIYIPEDMDLNNLGLFWLDETGKRYRYDSGEVPYDPSKPIVLYIHGWGGGGSIANPEDWIREGYNVGIMRWGELSTISPFDAQSKLWGIHEDMFWWERKNGKREFEDVPSHCVTEILVACYNDFFKEYGFYGKEIRFMGHSLGAQATLAISNHMLTSLEKGVFCADYLPDRITMQDPYLSDMPDPTTVSWLEGEDLSEGGSSRLAYLTAKALHEKGVAIEGIRTSVVRIVAELFGTDYYEDMAPYVTWVDVASDFYPEDYDLSNIADMSLKHEYALDWPPDMFDQGLVKDYSYQETAYAYSPHLPTAYSYARAGTLYDMPTNLLEDDMSDDYQYSQNITSAKIAGFAFADNNLNGINDERVACRLEGVKVALYEDGKTEQITETLTSKGGYYEFLLEESSFGKQYYIKVELPKGYKGIDIPAQSVRDQNLMNCNGVNKKLRSEAVEITDAGTLHIIHIGAKKKFTTIFSLK